MPARSPGSRACSFPTCSWLLDYAGPVRNSRLRPPSVAFPIGAHGRRPVCVFRSSIPGPSVPLSTLHPAPRGTQRKTRGQDGSLLLSCEALSSSTARRFIPAIALPYGRGSDQSRTRKQAVAGQPRISRSKTYAVQSCLAAAYLAKAAAAWLNGSTSPPCWRANSMPSSRSAKARRLGAHRS